MKTEDLINALVADLTVSRARLWQMLLGGLALGSLLAGALFFSAIGVRPDVLQALHSLRFLFKFVFTLSLAATATALLMCLAKPDVAPGRLAWAWLAAPLLLAIAVSVELFVTPASDWLPRLIGSNARFCLTLIPLLSIGPLACLLLAVRQGAPTQPGLAGAVAGLAASGVAATLYASHCTDDSPLFVATWYSLAISIVVLVGYAIGSRSLKW